jgi:hypothetical protein
LFIFLVVLCCSITLYVSLRPDFRVMMSVAISA